MRGSVYVIAGGKGGVGKTVTAVNLAVSLRRREHTVALVDADLSMPNLGSLVSVDADATIHDVLAGDAGLADAIVERADGFAVVLGDESLSAFDRADPTGLGDAVDSLAERYEFVILDTGAGVSLERQLPLGLADAVLLVTTPSAAAIENSRTVVLLAEFLGKPIRGLVVTRATDADAADAALDMDLDTEILTAVPDDDAVDESVRAGNPLDFVAPDSPAARAYRQLAEAVAGDRATRAQ